MGQPLRKNPKHKLSFDFWRPGFPLLTSPLVLVSHVLVFSHCSGMAPHRQRQAAQEQGGLRSSSFTGDCRGADVAWGTAEAQNGVGLDLLRQTVQSAGAKQGGHEQ